MLAFHRSFIPPLDHLDGLLVDKNASVASSRKWNLTAVMRNASMVESLAGLLLTG